MNSLTFLTFTYSRMAKRIVDSILGLKSDDSPSILAAATLFFVLASDVSTSLLLCIIQKCLYGSHKRCNILCAFSAVIYYTVSSLQLVGVLCLVLTETIRWQFACTDKVSIIDESHLCLTLICYEIVDWVVARTHYREESCWRRIGHVSHVYFLDLSRVDVSCPCERGFVCAT